MILSDLENHLLSGCTIQPSDPNYNSHPSKYFNDCMGYNEAGWDLGNFLILLLSLIFIGIGVTGALTAAAENVLLLGSSAVSLIFNLLGFLSGGQGSTATGVSWLITLAPYLFTYMIDIVLNDMNPIEATFAAAIITGDAGIFVGTDGTATAALIITQIAATAVSEYWWFRGYQSDLKDTDDIATAASWNVLL